MKGKRGEGLSLPNLTVAQLILLLIVLVILIVASSILLGKGNLAMDFIKNIFRW